MKKLLIISLLCCMSFIHAMEDDTVGDEESLENARRNWHRKITARAEAFFQLKNDASEVMNFFAHPESDIRDDNLLVKNFGKEAPEDLSLAAIMVIAGSITSTNNIHELVKKEKDELKKREAEVFNKGDS